jgi:hypothetical protein
MSKLVIVYHHRGQIERRCVTDDGRLYYKWYEAYSEDGADGTVTYPWLTYRECQFEAKQRGAKADIRK